MSNDFYVGYYEDHYFAHHGILGQKHGVKNGPPYPLDPEDHSAREKKAGWIKSLKTRHVERKKKKQRQKALEKARVAKVEKAKQAELQKKFDEEKEKVLRSGSASEILKYKGQMTNAEMQTAIDRIDKESRLYGLSQKEQKTAWDKLDNIFDKVGKVTNWVNKAADGYTAVDRLLKKFNGGDDDEDILQKAIKSGDLEMINRYKRKMTFSQLAQAMNKYNKERELDELLKQARAGKKTDDKSEEPNGSNDGGSKENTGKTKEESSRTSSSSTGFHYDSSEAKAYVNSLLRGIQDNGGSKSKSKPYYDYDGDTVDLDEYLKKSESKSSGSNGSSWWKPSGEEKFKKASDAVDDFTNELLNKGKKKKKK